MSTEIVIELEEGQITALKETYGELLGVDSLIKEIVLNELKCHNDLKSLREETKILNIGSAKLNSALGQYEQLVHERIRSIAPDVPITANETLTVSTSDTVTINDNVGTTPKQTAVRVGMDVQRVAPTPTPITVPKGPVTNMLHDGGVKLDPLVEKAMNEVRERNKAAAKIAAQRKGGNNVHNGGIVASQ